MGFGDAVGPLTSQLQNEFTLTNFMAGLVTFAGFLVRDKSQVEVKSTNNGE